MADSRMVVIGAPDLLPALQERVGTTGEVYAFSDFQPLAALEAIVTHRPQVIALERLFAATSRGAALINRIKADPSLAFAEIRVVSHDTEYSRVSPRHPSTEVAVLALPPAALDYRGTRRAARSRMSDGTEALVDGSPAAIVDLSVIGAQVISRGALRPNHGIRVTLADDDAVLRFGGAVAWASFEMRAAAPRYRGGIEFQGADADAVHAFLLRHAKGC
jgi:hypothetical protein